MAANDQTYFYQSVEGGVHALKLLGGLGAYIRIMFNYE